MYVYTRAAQYTSIRKHIREMSICKAAFARKKIFTLNHRDAALQRADDFIAFSFVPAAPTRVSLASDLATCGVAFHALILTSKPNIVSMYKNTDRWAHSLRKRHTKKNRKRVTRKVCHSG